MDITQVSETWGLGSIPGGGNSNFVAHDCPQDVNAIQSFRRLLAVVNIVNFTFLGCKSLQRRVEREAFQDKKEV